MQNYHITIDFILEALSTPACILHSSKIVTYNKKFGTKYEKQLQKQPNKIENIYIPALKKKLATQEKRNAKNQKHVLTRHKRSTISLKATLIDHEVFMIQEVQPQSKSFKDVRKYKRYIGSLLKLGKIEYDYEATILKELIEKSSHLSSENHNYYNLFSTISACAANILGGEKALTWICDSTNRLTVCGVHNLSTDYINKKDFSIRIGQGITGKHFSQSNPCFFSGIKDNAMLYHQNFPNNENVNHMVLIPIKYRNENVGAINVFSKKQFFNNKTTSEIVKSFGLIAGTYIRNLVMMDDIHENFSDLKAIILKRLETSQRAFSGPLSAMFNHEIKNILTIVYASLNSVHTNKRSFNALNTKQKKQFLDTIEIVDASVDMTKEASELFTYKTKKSELESIDLKSIINQAITFITPKLKSNQIEVTYIEGESDIRIKGDTFELLSIVFNLLTNSVKAIAAKDYSSSARGSIKISTKIERGGYAVVSVYDNGVGIKNKARDLIFNRGYTTDNKYSNRSSGIGLPTIKAIVESTYLGSISVHSRYGKHSEFTVRLKMER